MEISSISYQIRGRSGFLEVSSSNEKFRFYMELGGGSCVLIVQLPTQEYWETTFPEFAPAYASFFDKLGAQLVDEQTQGAGRFQRFDDRLEIYTE